MKPEERRLLQSWEEGKRERWGDEGQRRKVLPHAAGSEGVPLRPGVTGRVGQRPRHCPREERDGWVEGGGPGPWEREDLSGAQLRSGP